MCHTVAMFRLRTYDEVSSTNEVVKASLRAGEPEGLAVCARTQTGGYGRQGRVWASPEGGLYLSLLLRPRVPAEQLSTLSLVVGVAVRRACVSLVDEACSEGILLKWPNDVVYSAASKSFFSQRFAPDSPSTPCSCGTRATRSDSPRSRKASPTNLLRESSSNDLPTAFSSCEESVSLSAVVAAPVFAKLCGISLEALAGGVCVGIGVNVLPPAERLELDGKNVPAYLSDLGCSSVDAVRGAVLREAAIAYSAWLSQGLDPFLTEINEHQALFGRAVRVSDIRGETIGRGVVEAIDERGRLLVRSAEGRLEAVFSGEAHLS